METTFAVSASYKMGGHGTLYGQDPGFYHTLPNYHETVRDENGHAAVPAPDLISILSFAGSATLSSTVLATAIKAWLQSRRTKITITMTESNKHVTFEGPNLKDSVSEIQTLLEAMKHNEGNQQNLNVLAVRMDIPQITESQYKELQLR